LKNLTEIFGQQWAIKNILPKLLSLHLEANYLHRLTPLFGMAIMAPVISPDNIKKQFLPVLTQLSQDLIPNIRMNVAKTIMTIQPVIKGNADIEVNIVS
jgi:serine/threonine-protein phosphatase 2A regulatory subunit A